MNYDSELIYFATTKIFDHIPFFLGMGNPVERLPKNEIIEEFIKMI